MKRLPKYNPNIKPKGFRPKVFNSETREWASMYMNYRWRRYRDEFIKFNKTCYCCPRVAQVCDHIKPHKGDWALFENTENHLPLCNEHHNYCTANFDKFDTPKTDEKIKWLVNTRKGNGILTKVFVLNKEKFFPHIDR